MLLAELCCDCRAVNRHAGCSHIWERWSIVWRGLNMLMSFWTRGSSDALGIGGGLLDAGTRGKSQRVLRVCGSLLLPTMGAVLADLGRDVLWEILPLRRILRRRSKGRLAPAAGWPAVRGATCAPCAQAV